VGSTLSTDTHERSEQSIAHWIGLEFTALSCRCEKDSLLTGRYRQPAISKRECLSLSESLSKNGCSYKSVNRESVAAIICEVMNDILGECLGHSFLFLLSPFLSIFNRLALPTGKEEEKETQAFSGNSIIGH